MPFGAYRDIAHRWVGAEGAGPGHRDDIVFVGGFAAADHHHRGGIEHIAGLHLNFGGCIHFVEV